MAETCRECGRPAGQGARFCATCGAPLTDVADSDVRKTVTALFCDIVGSTTLAERTDPENVRALLEHYFGLARQALEGHGGTVEKFIGDAVVAFFGVPATREDDALRAVRAAFDVLGALDRANPELRERWGTELSVRVGVNTGEVVVSGPAKQVFGDAVNVAARLQQAAGPGQVLVGETTWRLVRDYAEGEAVEALELKGKGQRVPAWRVQSVAKVVDTVRAEGPLHGPLVGRDLELGLLHQSLERSRADRSCQLFTLFGAAGVGKSRLTNEFLEAQGPEVRVLRSRCLSYGDATSLWPLLEMLRSAAGLKAGDDEAHGRARLLAAYGDSPDAEQVTELLAPMAGLGGTSASIEEVQWAVRRWVEAMSRGGPVIWVVEDLHWAEPAFLSILEDVADWSRSSAVLLLCLARPEFLDDHLAWGGGKLNMTNVLLRPLSPSESVHLIKELVGAAELPGDVVTQVVSGSGGTPLFVEQLLAMLVDDGVLHKTPSGWQMSGDSTTVAVPPSIEALLAARLERLPPDEHHVLEAGSVVGQVFYSGAVAELAALPGHDVGRHLRSLGRKELIRAEQSDIAGEEAFSFSHILVRDSAYQALPKLRRAELHERLARWLDKRADSLAGQADDFVGHHLGEAVALRRSLGQAEATAALADEAATRLARAAWRLRATDSAAAVALYQRGADLVPGTVSELELKLRRGFVLFRTNEFGAARAALEDVVARAERSGDRGLSLRARLVWLEIGAHTDPSLVMSDVAAAVEDALGYFGPAGDHEGLALAYNLRVKQFNMAALWEPLVQGAEKVMYHAALCGDQLLLEQARAMRYVGLSWGPRPAPAVLELIDREAAMGETTQNGLAGRSMAAALLLAYGDQPEQARSALAEAKRVFQETHYEWGSLGVAFQGALVETILGDHGAAEAHLTYMFDALQRTGERSYLSTVAPMLGEIRCRQGNIEAAQELAELGRSLALEEDITTQSMWRMVAAKVAAAKGDFRQALTLAAEAVDWMGRTDQLSMVGDAHVGHAQVLMTASRSQEAAASLRRALEHYEAKGDVPDERRTRQLLEQLRV